MPKGFVTGKQNVEAGLFCGFQQGTVLESGPPHFVGKLHFVAFEVALERAWNIMIEEDFQ